MIPLHVFKDEIISSLRISFKYIKILFLLNHSIQTEFSGEQNYLIHETFIQINFRLDAVTPMSACIRDVASLKFKVLQRRIWTKEPRHTRSYMEYVHTHTKRRSEQNHSEFFFFSFFNPFMCHDEPRLKNLRNFCYLFRIMFMENINI